MLRHSSPKSSMISQRKQWTREQAQRQLMQIKQRRDGLAKTTRTPEETETFDVGMQRTLAQQYVQQGRGQKGGRNL